MNFERNLAYSTKRRLNTLTPGTISTGQLVPKLSLTPGMSLDNPRDTYSRARPNMKEIQG